LEHQVQGTLDGDAVDVDRDRGVRTDTFFFQSRFIEDNVDVGDCLNLANHIDQWNVVFVQRDLLLQALFDVDFVFALDAIIGSVLPFSLFARGFPHLLVEGHGVFVRNVRDHRSFDIVECTENGTFLFRFDVVIKFVLEGKLAFQHHRDDGGILRIEFLGLLGDDDCLGKTTLLVQVVVFFDQFRKILFDPDRGFLFFLDDILDSFVFGPQFDVRCLLFDLGSQRAA
jgi:hypothetical protein